MSLTTGNSTSTAAAAAATTTAPARTPLFAEPDVAYAVVQVAPPEDNEEQRAGVERTRAMLLMGDGECTTDCCIAVWCPCVSIAQISSSVGGSYLLNFIAYTVLYLGGLQFLVLAMRDWADEAFGPEHVAYAIGLEVAFFFVGPYISAPVATMVLVCYDCSASFDDDPKTDGFEGQTYYYVWADMALDVLFAWFAYAKVSTLRHHVHARNQASCRHCSGTCWVWFILGNASASAKEYARKPEGYLGPLDTIPAYS